MPSFYWIGSCMLSIDWLSCQWPWVTTTTPAPQFLHFAYLQRWQWSDGCVALSYKIEFQVKSWERGLDDIISVLQVVLWKEDNVWVWRNVWSMKRRVPGQEVDQRKLGQRLWKKTVKHVNWSGRMLWIIIDGVSEWMFLLLPADPSCPYMCVS